ncbi:acetyl-CoA carboxylase biotin carboxyl carrier protein [Salipiger mangrovisoli]|uniref:Biotin carboxyl carrier protein of acetyl-CoA carboxylase n=1 Tax=Salipiger mangrovisoli TaxID=2865933 RepID=A0ABR9X8Z8_9RHOB|nr:acetyl-CoA carboxylase biotin carboxyl carrier protein subunit [Salipiger mangrovisoli]MBE9640033.1 acetyl-CoA carboxylase, biotin carboxyl carrier protein [Salipiger mangrovisoli]
MAYRNVPLTLSEYEDLLRLGRAYRLDALRIHRGDWSLDVSFAPGPVVSTPAGAPLRTEDAEPPAAVQATPDTATHAIVAPVAGIVHLTAAPGEPALVAAGEKISAGTTVAVIEAMKMMTNIDSERGGMIAEVLVAAGDMVAAGQPLFLIREAEA